MKKVLKKLSILALALSIFSGCTVAPVSKYDITHSDVDGLNIVPVIAFELGTAAKGSSYPPPGNLTPIPGI